MIKNLPATQETRVRSLGQEDPREKGTSIHSSIPDWSIPWTEEPGRLQSVGLQSQTQLQIIRGKKQQVFKQGCQHYNALKTSSLENGLPGAGELETFTQEPTNSTVEGLGVSIPDLLTCTCSSANHVKTECSVSHNPEGDHEEVGLFRPLLDYTRMSVSTKMTNSLTTTAMQKWTWLPQHRQQALHHRTLHVEARWPFTRDFRGKISFHTSSSQQRCDDHNCWRLQSAYYPRGSAT